MIGEEHLKQKLFNLQTQLAYLLHEKKVNDIEINEYLELLVLKEKIKLIEDLLSEESWVTSLIIGINVSLDVETEKEERIKWLSMKRTCRKNAVQIAEDS